MVVCSVLTYRCRGNPHRGIAGIIIVFPESLKLVRAGRRVLVRAQAEFLTDFGKDEVKLKFDSFGDAEVHESHVLEATHDSICF